MAQPHPADGRSDNVSVRSARHPQKTFGGSASPKSASADEPNRIRRSSCFTRAPLATFAIENFPSILKPVSGPRFIPFVLLLTTTAPLFAHDIITTKLTYTRDISRIFLRRCVACHSADASIPLTDYQQVRPWAVDIKQQVLSRQMPPWGAVKGFGEFAPDEGLSQEELLIIAGWVVGGAPEGDPALLPPPVAKQSQPPEFSLRDALMVNTQNILDKPITLAAIKPLPATPIASTRIVANFPDGHIEPLLWLFQYDKNWTRTFRFRRPISLPAGTTIRADSPLRFALETKQ